MNDIGQPEQEYQVQNGNGDEQYKETPEQNSLQGRKQSEQVESTHVPFHEANCTAIDCLIRFESQALGEYSSYFTKRVSLYTACHPNQKAR